MNRSESSRIIKFVGEQLDHCFPPDKSRSLILGVSGGPDSMSLLYIFYKLEVDLTVVHCNYQLRGIDSDNDQKLVEDTASMWGFDAISVRLNPSEGDGENFQNWARNRRYEIFGDLKEEQEADAIATAHHQDDQLETIIQKILRGSGLTAWQGMKTWNGKFFRPLLDISKAEILQFASANYVPYRLDGSNEESTYARNFLRNGWFPILDDLFPGWRGNILKVPERAREHEAVVQSLVRSVKTDEKSILRDRLIALPSEVQKPLLLQMLKLVDPDITISSGALKNMDKLEMLQTGKKLAVNDRWYLIRDRNHFIISQYASGEQATEEVFARNDVEKKGLNRSGLQMRITEWNGHIRPERLQMDADSISWPLTARTWSTGDSINPLGMKGTQNISDHLTNEKISAAEKSTARVLETADGDICAVLFPPGFGKRMGTIAQWARCTDNTRVALLVSYK